MSAINPPTIGNEIATIEEILCICPVTIDKEEKSTVFLMPSFKETNDIPEDIPVISIAE
ncbi:hypothetical protein JCM19239_1515 [Vibrio variabilis]|uniref:Uncharacterized protein n=1 Tax=Vibrio variabilis TaxID=990271 RepID=A0ABQ0JGA0_9VIBR|nr:hypothetical protein JCM19239_1515 [Vibrio variabilis]